MRPLIRGSSTSATPGEDAFRTFLGVPVIDRGVLQGVLVVQTRESRTFTDEEVQMLDDGRRAAVVDRQRSAHRRAVRGAGASAARRARAEPVVELGQRERQPVSRSRSGALAAVRPQSDRDAPADRRSIGSRAAPRSWRCTAASTTPIGGCRSI